MRVGLTAVVALSLLALAFLPVPPGLSQEKPSIAGDERVGVVVDLQGTALVRPVGHDRASPLAQRSVLMPGDLVRTMLRGAHALEIRLAGGGTLVLGPGSVVELPERGVVRLLRGEAEVAGTAKTPLTVTGPGGFDSRVSERVVLRAATRETVLLDEAPRWLTGYRSSTTDEWMGSLMANVDGRNVPLTVGYHKVSVVIRDQIAETTVEESFVNSTKRTLEGVFTFPLPADASISGFGMWIGDELVEADIVERQKARAIYEDILRRRKDPGLLEWSGGNLFKASVFPIFPHSEKRIRIRYTQVLPLEGAVLRYRYALRSELLRAHPLRELRIRVAVDSSAPITKAASPSHEVRVRNTEHQAVLEFDAEGYSPESDFEVTITLDRTRPLTVLPHRRGEDGYFMLLLSPPDASSGAWSRDLLPEGDPLDLLLVADTSGSMDPAARKAQADFLDALLALLGPRDTFRMMAVDTTVGWITEQPAKATGPHTRGALARLAGRESMGWTDLDLAFGLAAERAGEGTLVVYVGDGIGTTGDADPAALARRIEALGRKTAATFHAVATDSTYEQVVMEAVAGLGGGSFRGTGDNPVRAAFGLLSEVAQPAVKDLRVRFEGVRTARVYPERLPNLPAGRQQAILGRFLPTGEDQQGTVIVTGTLDGRPVRYTAPFEITEEESGNSFLPRLWARRHLDALLAEGRNAANQEEIVAFSEEFGILTPLTSFLVLESDEDRERYGVTRRVRMRDGERFFAEGRDRAATEILRQQMKKAKTWRLRLRETILREIARLGRDLVPATVAWGDVGRLAGSGGWGFGGEFDGDGSRSRLGFEGKSSSTPERYFDSNETDNEDYRETAGEDLGERTPEDPPPPASPQANRPYEEAEKELDSLRESLEKSISLKDEARRRQRQASGDKAFDGYFGAGGPNKPGGYFQQWLQNLLSQRFPHLPPPAEPLPPVKTPDWSPEILEALASLDRGPGFRALMGGVEVVMNSRAVHPLRGDVTSRSHTRQLISAESWFTDQWSMGGEPVHRWLDGGMRGALLTGQRLGRRRPAVESDREAVWARTDWVRTYAKWDAEIASREAGVVTIRFTSKNGTRSEISLTIDTAKRVILAEHWYRDGKLTRRARFSDFQQAGGLWWAGKATYFDAEGREISRAETEIEELDAVRFAGALKEALRGHEDVIFLDGADPTLEDAKQARSDGDASFVDHLVIAQDHAARQRWEEAWKSFEAAAALVEGKPGADWLRAGLLSVSRRGEAMKTHLLGMAGAVAKREGPVGWALANQLYSFASGVFSTDELLALIARLESAGGNDGWAGIRKIRWLKYRAQHLQNAGRPTEARELWREILTTRPRDPQANLDYLNALILTGDVDAALEFTAVAREHEGVWLDHEASGFYQRLTDVLWQTQRLSDLLEITKAWIARAPKDSSPYARRLTALYHLDRVEEFDSWVEEQFETEAKDLADGALRARLTAAIDAALGSGWNLYYQHMDEKWVEPLARLARRLAKVEKQGRNLSGRVFGNWRFQRSHLAGKLRVWFREDLVADGAIEEMEVARLIRYLGWLRWERPQVDDTTWRSVTDRVRARFERAQKPVERQQLAAWVLALLDARKETGEAVGFLRDRLEDAPDTERPQVARDLMYRLVKLPFTPELEDELLGLLKFLPRPEAEKPERKQVVAGAVRWLADRLLSMRVSAGIGSAEEREKLPRSELRMKYRAARKAARAGLVERFFAERARAIPVALPWLEIERVCFAVELSEDLAGVEGEAREILLSTPGDAVDRMAYVLRQRSALVLSHAAARRSSPEGLADRVLALFKERLAAESEQLDWRYEIFRLLVALDRVEELEAELLAWIQPEKVDSRWRIALGYLLAERGELEEAANLFERVAELDELGERGYASLADWYLALGDDPRRETALEARYERMPEHRLSQLIGKETNKVSRRGEGVPADLDPEVLRVIRAVLEKATHPANHLWSVRNLYRTVKDFRLLAALADGMLGHTPQGIYPFLEQVGQAVSEVHEEATLDEIAARIAERMKDAETDTDRRALHLFTAVVEGRAARVRNEPGPHIENALEALRDSARGSWLAGERRLAASFLASLGKLPNEALAGEQIRQLTALHRDEKPGSVDRLRIALFLDRTQWGYGRHDRALDGLTAAIDEHRDASGGRLPPEANDVADTLVSWLTDRSRFGRGEKFVTAERDRQQSRAQKDWYTGILFRVYVRCLERKGAVSIGSGETLYREARGLMEKGLADLAPGYFGQTLGYYCALHRAAHKVAHVASAGDDLIEFSRGLLRELLPGKGRGQANHVLVVAQAIHDIKSPLAGLTLLVERLEEEPAWYRRQGRDGWNSFAWQLAVWRREAKNIGELSPRLLARVLAEMERDLLSMQARARYLYSRRHREFWAEMEPEFLTVADRVIELNPNSPARLLYAANYLWHDLRKREKAVATLVAAEERGVLSVPGRYQLVTWLHYLSRYGESIPYLETLNASHPDDMNYRVLMIRALAKVGRGDDGKALVDRTIERFKAQKRWSENAIAPLAGVCLEGRFLTRCVALYEELIPLHQRSNRRARGGRGDGTLSSYYGSLAQAYSGLGRKDEAVDAASAAVLSWGRDYGNRAAALKALRAVLAEFTDLDDWVARWDAEAEKTGLDSPVIRLALGDVYLEKKEPKKAIAQLEIARKHQPMDKKVHEALIKAHDQAGDKAGACAALAAFARAFPREFRLHRTLGQRLAQLGDAAAAERAVTNLAEVAPNEAEGHRMLALILERRKRFPDAVTQWEQVVRVRTLEPAGWFSLAGAQKRADRVADAEGTLRRMLERTWEPRFGDVKKKVARILAELDR